MVEVQIIKEVADFNVGYLLLAQKLLRADRAWGMLRLGTDSETADLVLSLSTHDICRIAACGHLLCGLRSGDALRAALQNWREPSVQLAHLSIMLTGVAADGASRGLAS